MKSSLLPYRRVVIIRSSKDSCRRKVSDTGVTWDIITNSFYGNFELTCRAWVSRALWSRTSPSLLVSVHEHILSVKHQIHVFTNTTYKPSSGISFFQNDACNYIKLTCSGTCHVLHPTRQHWQWLSLAASVQTSKEINLQQNIRALKPLSLKLPESAGTWVCCPPPAPQLWQQPRPGMQQWVWNDVITSPKRCRGCSQILYFILKIKVETVWHLQTLDNNE